MNADGHEPKTKSPESLEPRAQSRVLIIATTTGYQVRAFGEAAVRAGVEPVFATDCCHTLDNPWRDGAIPVRFHDEIASVDAIVAATAAAASRPIHGIVSLGDRPAVLGARAARALGLPHHAVDAARAAGHKQLARERFRRAGLLTPSAWTARADTDPRVAARMARYPCVLKPLTLSASRGVIRANDPEEFHRAFRRVAALLEGRLVQALRDPATAEILIEQYVDGVEYAVEGLLDRGGLRILAIFDKPDPLVGPFFEETIYVTPSRATPEAQEAIAEAIGRACAALGLSHGPLHAECRVNDAGVYVLEAAARPIGGLCARVLRFTQPDGTICTLEELLVRHAVGEAVGEWPREGRASGVMMVPIPRAGVFRGVSGVEDATAVAGVDEVRITAKIDQQLVPLPEGASYLGFIFARAAEPEAVEAALRDAHSRLHFAIDRFIPVC